MFKNIEFYPPNLVIKVSDRGGNMRNKDKPLTAAMFKDMYIPHASTYQYIIYFIRTAKDYGQAITFYSEAITLNPFIVAYYANRSFSYLKTECYGYALADANKALDLDKSFVKVFICTLFFDFAFLNYKINIVDLEKTVMKCIVSPLYLYALIHHWPPLKHG